MNAYGGLSAVYDRFMQDAPHDDWIAWLDGHYPSLRAWDAVDLGCGTGVFTIALAERCRTVVGVDQSESMLSEAAARAAEAKKQVLWLCQDMRSVRLPHPVDLAISTCDSLNYLLSTADLAETVQRTAQTLRPGGLFMFDLLGPKRLQSLQSGFWYDLREDAAVLFETSVDNDARIRYDVHVFIKDAGLLYRRIIEQHEQQYYAQDTALQVLSRCGFDVLEVMGDFGRTEIAAADRVSFIARRQS